MKKRLYYATGNSGKFEVVKNFFEKNSDFEIIQFDGDVPEEQTEDQEKIAIAKAKAAWDILKEPVLVDDIGIYFHNYNKFPGTMTKLIYQGLGFEGLFRLYDEGDGASFILTLVYAYGPDQFKVFTQESPGYLTKLKILDRDSKLPFESIFIPAGYDKTYKELKFTKEYENINCRIQALKKFLNYIQNIE